MGQIDHSGVTRASPLSILTQRLKARGLSKSLTGQNHPTEIHLPKKEASESKHPFATSGEGQQCCPKLIDSS